jgi:predicted nucleotide-binding protein (sugar kinase/HSP70/actin superfamily)
VALRQLIEKHLLHRGRRNAICHVYLPVGLSHTYTIILEEIGVREQFFMDVSQVEKFIQTGNQQFVLNEVRTAVRNLDRLVNKKKMARQH